MSDPFDLTGRVALVTGGSRGLGLAMVKAFAEHGASVIVASRKADACAAVAKELPHAVPFAFNVSHWDDCDRLIDFAYATHPQVDILVNNAGMSPLYPSVDQITEELFDKVVGVNLKGPFRLASVIGARMAAGRGGSIINVSSIAAVQPSPVEIPYAAAKAGLNNLTLGLSRIFGPSVRVNTIMPGPFMTDVTKAWDLDSFNANAKTRIPLQRGGEPEEIVGAALYLASDASSYTTGATIKIDGGLAYA
jgi:NAD(P)-dependent dehydrogenase (short-subunit alcohol dehydrogenase family)